MHSWDMINVKYSKTTKLCSKERFHRKLEDFLIYSSKRLNYIKMNELIKSVK